MCLLPCIFSADRAVEVIVGTDCDRPAEWKLFFNSGLLSVWGVRGKHRHAAPQRLCWGPNSISASSALCYWNSFQKKRWRVVSHSFAQLDDGCSNILIIFSRVTQRNRNYWFETAHICNPTIKSGDICFRQIYMSTGCLKPVWDKSSVIFLFDLCLTLNLVPTDQVQIKVYGANQNKAVALLSCHVKLVLLTCLIYTWTSVPAAQIEPIILYRVYVTLQHALLDFLFMKEYCLSKNDCRSVRDIHVQTDWGINLSHYKTKSSWQNTTDFIQ